MPTHIWFGAKQQRLQVPPRKSSTQHKMEMLHEQKTNLKKQMKAAPVEEQTGLQALWQDLRVKYSALSRPKSAGKSPNSQQGLSKCQMPVRCGSVSRYRAPPSTGVVVTGTVEADEQPVRNVLIELMVGTTYLQAQASPGVLIVRAAMEGVHVTTAVLQELDW
ncbi:reverse transcriptase [Plakobranchus ocellatus]|uniref:Reverse transcriptase n=1 Tax=Plakobranchus ocellatus TaxID=259542 RepID=A0AAV3Y6S6_9GAST|nr:reverse transcriptase [Plakobranchus ocellatus]